MWSVSGNVPLVNCLQKSKKAIVAAPYIMSRWPGYMTAPQNLDLWLITGCLVALILGGRLLHPLDEICTQQCKSPEKGCLRWNVNLKVRVRHNIFGLELNKEFWRKVSRNVSIFRTIAHQTSLRSAQAKISDEYKIRAPRKLKLRTCRYMYVLA